MKDEIEHLSFSQINQWLGCQMQYWLSRVEKQTPIDLSANLIIGTAYHTAVEMFHRAKQKNEPTVQLDEMLAVFEQIILEEESENIVNWGTTNRTDEVKKAAGVFTAFLKDQENNPNTVFAVEDMFRLDLEGLPPIIGRVDLIEQEPSGALVIIDYKSAATKPSVSSDTYVPSDVDASHQVTLYQIWGKQKFPKQVIKLRMDYLIKSAKTPVFLPITTKRSEEQEHHLIALMKSVYDQIQMAKAGVIEPVPCRSFKCSGCGYRAICQNQKAVA